MFEDIATLYRRSGEEITRLTLRGVMWQGERVVLEGSLPSGDTTVYIPGRALAGETVEPGDWLVLGDCPHMPVYALSEASGWGLASMTVRGVKSRLYGSGLAHLEVVG